MTCSAPAPTAEDARRAAEMLVHGRAGTVFLHGSAVRGDATKGSGIDLVAIYDDIDYDQRWKMAFHLERAASEAADHYVGVSSPTGPT